MIKVLFFKDFHEPAICLLLADRNARADAEKHIWPQPVTTLEKSNGLNQLQRAARAQRGCRARAKKGSLWFEMIGLSK